MENRKDVSPVVLFLFFLAILGLGGIFLAIFARTPIALVLTALSLLPLLNLKEVPASPPHVAVPTLWGRRQYVVLREGKKLIANYFPFFLDLILIDVEKKNNDFSYAAIRCRLGTEDGVTPQGPSEPKSGGEVKAEVSITWEPDTSRPKRLIDYLNSGVPKSSTPKGPSGGIVTIVEDMLAEDIRQMGIYRTWEEMVFSKDILSVILINKLTGMQLPKYRRDSAGGVVLDNDSPVMDGFYPIDQIITRQAEVRAEDVEYFLKNALTNGVGDIHDLGIRIRRLNVTEVQPTGALAQDAEGAARETQQRTKETRDNRTGIEMAQQLISAAKESGDPDAFWQAHEIGRITRRRATEIIIRGAEGNPIAAAAAVFKKGGPNE